MNTTDLLTSGWTEAEAKAEIPNLFDALASMNLSQLVVRVVPDGKGGWGHLVPGFTRCIAEQYGNGTASAA